MSHEPAVCGQCARDRDSVAAVFILNVVASAYGRDDCSIPKGHLYHDCFFSFSRELRVLASAGAAVLRTGYLVQQRSSVACSTIIFGQDGLTWNPSLCAAQIS